MHTPYFNIYVIIYYHLISYYTCAPPFPSPSILLFVLRIMD